MRTNTHNDAIAVPLEMKHPFLWALVNVVQHLNTFSLMQLAMLLVADCFGQVLMDQLPHNAPPRRVVHQQQMITLGDELLRD